MKRILRALMAVLLTACSGTIEPPAGLGSLTGEWYALYAVPDFTAEWSLSLTEMSIGYVAGSFTETSYAGLRPTPEPVTWVETGRVAGEHGGIDIVLAFLYEGDDQVGFEGRQIEANIFRGTLEGWGTLDFVRVDPS